MARQRRGGFRPPELRGTLGTLLRTTLAQAGVVRDALERGAREGRSRLDDALAGRRRHEALAELGERVLDLIRQGEIDLAELPELHDLVAHLDDLDAHATPGATDDDDFAAADFAALPGRARFDHRGGGAAPHDAVTARIARNRFRGAPDAAGDDAVAEDAAWDATDEDDTARASHGRGAAFRGAVPRGGGRGDGTVSSGAWRPPARPARPAPRVWRPLEAMAGADGAPAGHDPEPTEDVGAADVDAADAAARSSSEITSPGRPAVRRPDTAPGAPGSGPAGASRSSAGPSPAAPADDRAAHSRPAPGHPFPKQGGISFDDEDLADYMHPDDVPPKGSRDRDS